MSRVRTLQVLLYDGSYDKLSLIIHSQQRMRRRIPIVIFVSVAPLGPGIASTTKQRSLLLQYTGQLLAVGLGGPFHVHDPFSPPRHVLMLTCGTILRKAANSVSWEPWLHSVEAAAYAVPRPGDVGVRRVTVFTTKHPTGVGAHETPELGLQLESVYFCEQSAHVFGRSTRSFVL